MAPLEQSWEHGLLMALCLTSSKIRYALAHYIERHGTSNYVFGFTDYQFSC